jgi:hypothetical protein
MARLASAASLTVVAFLASCSGDPVPTHEPDGSSSAETSTSYVDPSQGMSQSSSSPGTTVAPEEDVSSSESDGSSSSDGSSGFEPGTTESSGGTANAPPVALGETWTVRPGDTFAVDADNGVLLNDVDPDGDALSVIDYETISHFGGAVVIGSDGATTYQTPPGFTGVDGFAYTISDGSDATETSVLVFVYP